MASAAGGAGAEDPMAAFAVAKGGVVLKHIFLNAPPTDEAPRGGYGDEEEEDPPVLFGRHPDCHVLVDHPSVSRRHLEIRCKRRQRRITVTDLSSVHGTWVAGQRIPPNTPVELVAGDTLQFGSSRREYRLHWLSLREAFEMEDLLPPLVEEDKKEFRTHQNPQEIIQQVVSEQIDLPAKLIPSAPSLPEFTHPISLEDSSFSQFDGNRVEVIEEKMVNDNPVTESTGSSITQGMPATVTSVGTPIHSDKQGASSTVSRRAKLKSVKSLQIDTGRSIQKSSTLSYSYQKEAQNENLLCSQNCGRGREACMLLFDKSDVKEPEEKEKIIAADKDYMNPHQLDNNTQEENQEVTNPLNFKHPDKENSMLNFAKDTEQHDIFSENSIPQDSVDVVLQKIPDLLYSVSPLVFKDDTSADEIPHLDATANMKSYEHMSENPFMQDIVGENMNSHEDMKHGVLSYLNMDGSLSNMENVTQSNMVVCPDDCDHDGTIYGSLFANLNIKGTEENEENSLLDKEHITPCVSANITMERSQLTLKPTGSQELMDFISPLSLQHENLSDYENSMPNTGKQMESIELISENLSLLTSVDARLQKSQTESMPTAHLDFENDTFEDKENSVLAPGKYDAAISPVRQGGLFPDKKKLTPASRDLKSTGRKVLGSRFLSDYENSMPNTGKQMESIELISKNLSLLTSVDARLQKSQTESMPTSHLDFENDTFEDKENSVLAPGKYDAAISPVRQGGLFPDKKKLTPASRDLKSTGRKVLGSRMDSSVSAECALNRSINKQDYNELSSKSKGFHTVDDEAFYSDKENLTPMSSGGVKARRCVPKILFTVDVDQDQDAFYNDKENSTPVSSASQKTRDMSENHARIESAITKKRVVDRLPFQTLLSNSPLRPNGSFDCAQSTARAADVAIRLEDELNNLQHNNQESDRVGEGMKVWTMVTDTGCLLDDESRKSIMLLKGIKGTHLIVPRIVIRELDCMKQREGLFRRSSKATSILQWIEECMENESWWIHVQSSSEMLPVPPTPPVTPRTQYNNEGEGEQEAAAGAFCPMLSLFSPRSFTSMVSPKTEDRILDCALLFGKLRSSSKNIIILSNSVTLKIKAMAEGLLCEGAKEFRETLMNPCSGRFMWAASAPRGAAWSCLDEAALAENYYNSHHHHGARSKVPRPVESARGLKLILLHNNSLYAQAINSLPKKTPLAPLSPW